jgi:alpha-L-arabinofuranosidase
MHTLAFPLFLILFLSPMLQAENARILVDSRQVIARVTPWTTGACIEDVNHEVYGGIYSQMIFGESFQEPLAASLTSPAPADQSPAKISRTWRELSQGSAVGSSSLDTKHPFIGSQSLRLTFEKGEGEVGVENRGLNRWGMNFVAKKPYQGYVWARADQPTELFASMESGDGSTSYAQTTLHIEAGDWRRVDFALTPNASDVSARFALTLKRPGSVVLGHAFLQPDDWGRFKGLPVRKDVAEGLIAQGLTVLRYGGSMVNAPEYRWKKMIGPRDRRPPYKGTWYPFSSNGWGIIDFLSFCEAAGFLGIPAFNMDETPTDMADFVEYVNGAPDSDWGRRRARDGHPQPYKLKFLELGNEEAVNESYWKKLKPLAEAIWAKDPSITPVVGDFAYGQHIADPYQFKGAPSITSLAAHKKILDFATSRHKPVWFDVHINNDNPRDPERQIDVIGELAGWLAKISPGAQFKICVFEENANNHAMRRALGHARAINGLQRLGDVVPIVCCANCLQCDGQNDNGWDQGLLFLNPHQVWAQPPYFVTQIVAKNYLPKCVKADVSGAEGLDVTARASEDGRVLTLQIMNPTPREIPAQIQLEGFTRSSPTVDVTQVSGELNAVNTAKDPGTIEPIGRKWSARFQSGAAAYTFPPCSFSLLRFE